MAGTAVDRDNTSTLELALPSRSAHSKDGDDEIMKQHVVSGILCLAMAGCAQSRLALNNEKEEPKSKPVALAPVPSIYDTVNHGMGGKAVIQTAMANPDDPQWSGQAQVALVPKPAAGGAASSPRAAPASSPAIAATPATPAIAQTLPSAAPTSAPDAASAPATASAGAARPRGSHAAVEDWPPPPRSAMEQTQQTGTVASSTAAGSRLPTAGSSPTQSGGAAAEPPIAAVSNLPRIQDQPPAGPNVADGPGQTLEAGITGQQSGPAGAAGDPAPSALPMPLENSQARSPAPKRERDPLLGPDPDIMPPLNESPVLEASGSARPKSSTSTAATAADSATRTSTNTARPPVPDGDPMPSVPAAPPLGSADAKPAAPTAQPTASEDTKSSSPGAPLLVSPELKPVNSATEPVASEDPKPASSGPALPASPEPKPVDSAALPAASEDMKPASPGPQPQSNVGSKTASPNPQPAASSAAAPGGPSLEAAPPVETAPGPATKPAAPDPLPAPVPPELPPLPGDPDKTTAVSKPASAGLLTAEIPLETAPVSSGPSPSSANRLIAELAPKAPRRDAQVVLASTTVSDRQATPEKKPNLKAAGYPVARVGDEIITRHDLIVALKEAMTRYPELRQQSAFDSMEVMEKRQMTAVLARQTLADLIVRTMLAQEAKRLIQKHDPKEFDRFLETVDRVWRSEELPPLKRRYNVDTDQQLRDKLAEQGRLLESMRLSFRQSALADFFLHDRLKDKLGVELPELLRYYNERMPLHDFDMPASITWRELLVEVGKYQSRAEARLKAERLLRLLENGEDFAKLARAESDGPSGSRSRGGLMQTTPGGYAVPAVNSALETLKIGRLSGILEGPESFHIVKVDNRRPAGPASFEEVQDKIRPIIARKKEQQERVAYLAKLRKKTIIWTVYDGTPNDPRELLP
jgi:peptidyl-prolyl cis-trans isomerase SurA